MAKLVEEKETRIFLLLAIILIFLSINYDPTVSIAYISFAFFNLLTFVTHDNWSFSLGRGYSFIKAAVVSFIAYGAFIGICTVVGKQFAPAIITSPMSVVHLMSETVPVLKNSLILTWLAFGVIIPIIETDTFFGRINELVADFFKLDKRFDLSNPLLWSVIVIIAASFSIFHLTAKIVNLNVGLTFTFIFAVISLLLVYYYRRTAEACGFHIMTNSIAVASSFGVGPFG